MYIDWDDHQLYSWTKEVVWGDFDDARTIGGKLLMFVMLSICVILETIILPFEFLFSVKLGKKHDSPYDEVEQSVFPVLKRTVKKDKDNVLVNELKKFNKIIKGNKI